MDKSTQLKGILSRATTTTPKPAQAPTADVVQLDTAKAPEPAKPAKIEKVKATAEKTREPQKSIQAYVPTSIDRALKMRAAEEGTTTRTLILQGLKAIGFDVPEHELRDQRAKS